ncbi:hypothetical protein GCM10009751_30080 [Myceligenerans crystallogenes]|uniref:Rhodanese domain-containing protein n=1 Tax=Myceligenerans crystallogenes TaxID=316335 RepID=A0ABN2NHC3_9MICO
MRYARHLALPGIGVEGQRRLAAAKVLVVGAGGLGSPALLYLAAAGVGTLGIVDDDVVEASNLQRQVIHGQSDLGVAKTESAAATIREVNPHVVVVGHRERLTAGNALDLLGGYDLVLDGSDSFATRYLVSDAAEILGIPCVWGALHRFTGQAATFWARPPHGDGVTYRDVFPVPPPPGASPDCATAGVFGAVCGTIGTVMATEAIKLITGAGRTLLGRLAVYDALDVTWRTLTVRPDPDRAPVTELLGGPGNDAVDPYAVFCGIGGPAKGATAPAGAEGTTTPAGVAVDGATASAGGAAEGVTVPAGGAVEGATAPAGGAAEGVAEISGADLLALRADGGEPLVLDVREEWEAQLEPFPGARVVPSGEFAGPGAVVVRDVGAWAGGRTVHVLCAAGLRSRRVAETLRDAGLDARSVTGGLRAIGPAPA